MPRLTARFGLLRLLHFVLCICIVLYFSQGYVRYLYEMPLFNAPKGWVWAGLLLCLTIKTLCHSISFTACTILTNDVAPRMDALGTINGFSQCRSLPDLLLCNFLLMICFCHTQAVQVACAPLDLQHAVLYGLRKFVNEMQCLKSADSVSVNL